MAPTEVRVARPERQWGCRRGTPQSMEGHALAVLVSCCLWLSQSVWHNMTALGQYTGPVHDTGPQH